VLFAYIFVGGCTLLQRIGLISVPAVCISHANDTPPFRLIAAYSILYEVSSPLAGLCVTSLEYTYLIMVYSVKSTIE